MKTTKCAVTRENNLGGRSTSLFPDRMSKLPSREPGQPIITQINLNNFLQVAERVRRKIRNIVCFDAKVIQVWSVFENIFIKVGKLVV